MTTDPYAEVTALLAARGAGSVAHPGGTLLAHLHRVRSLLEEWGARPAVQVAGLSHAFYGTDGFPIALGQVTERDVLASVVGEEAEQLVYLYASCDRDFSYPRLTDGVFRDRFSGTVLHPSPRMLRDFAEITVANELDVLGTDGVKLFSSFVPWKGLLSGPAWRACNT